MNENKYKECQDHWSLRRILWSSNKEDPTDYYADKLELLCMEDSKFALRLSVGGTVTQMEIKNIADYVWG